MKKKYRNVAAFLVMVLTVSLSACGGTDTENLGDEYNQGTDYQYMLDCGTNSGAIMARGENGYFFLEGHYIYYLDDEMQTLVPLCNKANCMHNEETDSDRYADCNAYVEYASSIAYCNGYLYVVDGMGDQTLYRIKENGAVRESVMEWPVEDGMSVGMWSVHRDKVYYTEQSIEVEGEDVADVCYLKCASLKSSSKADPEVVYELPEGLILVSFGTIRVYGNYLYFQVVAVSEEDYELYYKEFIYNIRDGSLTEMVPDETEGAMVSMIAFWNGRVVCTVYDEEINQTYGDIRIYVTDLDGSNPELLMDDVPYGTYIYSDETWLYMTNYYAMVMGEDDEQYYKVYDSGLNLVDTFVSPFESVWSTCIGMAEGTYFWTVGSGSIAVDEDGNTTGYRSMTLQFFDKSDIGTLDGAEFTYSEVAAWEQSPADQD